MRNAGYVTCNIGNHELLTKIISGNSYNDDENTSIKALCTSIKYMYEISSLTQTNLGTQYEIVHIIVRTVAFERLTVCHTVCFPGN